MVKMWSVDWNSLQEIEKIASTFKQGKYFCLFYKLVITFCCENISIT